VSPNSPSHSEAIPHSLMHRKVHKIDDVRLCTGSPSGLKPYIQQYGCRLSEVSLQYSALESRQFCLCRYRRKSKVLPLSRSINRQRFHHVHPSIPKAFSTRLRVTASRPTQVLVVKTAGATNCRDGTITVASSGQSSPQTSYSSLSFSHTGSSSSRSTPSSQNSFSALSPRSTPYIRRQPRIQVSSLLSDPHTRTYHLEVIQHPLRTAEFGYASLSRLPLTPPIVARLTVRDPSGNSVVPDAELPFLIAHLSLFTENGLTPLDMGSFPANGQSPPILYGNLVSSVDQLEDLQGNLGLFFLFPDVSIRWRGRFQLGVSLLRISRTDPSGALSIADQGTVLAETRTSVFDVLPYNQYIAAPPTRLTQCFIRQGARMFTFMSNPNP